MPALMGSVTIAVTELRLHEKALKIRLFAMRLLKLFAEGRLLGTVRTCLGEKWTGVALAEHLQKEDVIFGSDPYLGHYLARIGNYFGQLAERRTIAVRVNHVGIPRIFSLWLWRGWLWRSPSWICVSLKCALPGQALCRNELGVGETRIA